MYRIGCNLPGSCIWDGKLYNFGTYERLKKAHDYAIACGFDYVETNMGNIMKLSDSEIEKAGKELKIRAVNGFLPKNLYSNYNECKEYAKKAFARLKILGVESCVFGSGRFRKITFPKLTGKKKWAKLKEYLAFIADLAEQSGVTITIEPLNYKETNVINTVAEACDIVREINKPALRALGDIYHMALVGEDFSVFKKEEDLVKHIHICEKNRTMPGQANDSFLADFFAVIQTTSYDGKMSTEAGIKDFAGDVKKAAEVLKPYQA